MPAEYLILKNRVAPIERCPDCGAYPFDCFMRGMVKSYWRAFWGRPCWCVICSQCKEIVGYELACPRNSLRRTLYDIFTSFRARRS
jgi:hypothetical protein